MGRRIAAVVARLRRRRPAAANGPRGVVLAAGVPLPPQIVPGVGALLGLPRRQATEAGESLEALCARISRGGPARYRVHVAADGTVAEVIVATAENTRLQGGEP